MRVGQELSCVFTGGIVGHQLESTVDNNTRNLNLFVSLDGVTANSDNERFLQLCDDYEYDVDCVAAIYVPPADHKMFTEDDMEHVHHIVLETSGGVFGELGFDHYNMSPMSKMLTSVVMYKRVM